jgi:hypothetical protein
MTAELQRDAAEPVLTTVGLPTVQATAFAASAIISLMALSLLCLVRNAELGSNPQDFVAILDGGYRISQGQWPHIDFAVPHGAWPLLQGWFALKFAPICAPFLTYQFTQWLTVLPVALYLAAQQRSPWLACALLLVVAVATLVPYVIDFLIPPTLNYFAGYNRLVTALLFLTFVWAAAPRRRIWIEALVVAILLLTLLATKITGFVVGVGVVSVVACLSPVKRSLALRAGAILIGALVLLQITTRLPLAYLSDIRTMLAINRSGIGYEMVLTALKSIPALVALAVLGFALLPGQGTARGGRLLLRLRVWRAPLLVVVITTATLAAESQAVGNLLLVAASALLFVPLPRHRLPGISLPAAKTAVAFATFGPWLGAVVYVGVLVTVRLSPQSVPDASLERLLPRTVTTTESLAIAADNERIAAQTDPPNALLTELATESQPSNFVALARSVDEAAAKARRLDLVGPDAAVMTIGQVDYFARILDARSPKGTNLWQAEGRTFGAPAMPELRHYLRNVSAAFMRRCNDDKTFSVLNPIFLPALEADFVPHDLTACWAVWIRKPRG